MMQTMLSFTGKPDNMPDVLVQAARRHARMMAAGDLGIAGTREHCRKALGCERVQAETHGALWFAEVLAELDRMEAALPIGGVRVSVEPYRRLVWFHVGRGLDGYQRVAAEVRDASQLDAVAAQLRAELRAGVADGLSGTLLADRVARAHPSLTKAYGQDTAA